MPCQAPFYRHKSRTVYRHLTSYMANDIGACVHMIQTPVTLTTFPYSVNAITQLRSSLERKPIRLFFHILSPGSNQIPWLQPRLYFCSRSMKGKLHLGNFLLSLKCITLCIYKDLQKQTNCINVRKFDSFCILKCENTAIIPVVVVCVILPQ